MADTNHRKNVYALLMVHPASLACFYPETISPLLLTALAGISQVHPASLACFYPETISPLLLTALAGISQVRFSVYNDKDSWVADSSKIPGSFQPSTPEPTPDPESPSTPIASLITISQLQFLPNHQGSHTSSQSNQPQHVC
ncbi:hypothetical protein PCASD_08683 [Puccinia coronata f. sp. avenae]|uniref:Uncharacterized protein n=1 Tax=Puccinia coronata f. sp. avenae TaxID=200324 RepID=A0A2N5UG64_9BASI|nr:hypothetical protein PCASD_08683 [Puccinia coronata f. sp. avenae]